MLGYMDHNLVTTHHAAMHTAEIAGFERTWPKPSSQVCVTGGGGCCCCKGTAMQRAICEIDTS